jgi:pentatricopeptide repeat protein
MKNRWYNLTPSAEISIIISLLRDGQYELALTKLEELNKIPINVPPWLFDVFLYIFGDLGFHEETLAILKHRQRVVDVVKRAPLSLNAWQFLLEVFSRDAFQPGVKYIWDHSVIPGSIHPPDGVVLNVLNAASMHGDTSLVMSAMQVLSTRGMKLELHHYEALIHVHIQHGDLRKALAVLCIMAKAGLSPDLASTRPIFHMLRDSSTSTDKALKILHELKVQYTIPAAAFNVVLESAATHGGFRIAFDLYRTVRQVCVNGPDLETFDILLRYCTLQKSLNFIVAEMEALSLKPSKAVLDHLIRICSMQDNYEMAFRYLDMMHTRTPAGLSETWWLSKDSALALIRRCIQARDPRFEGILEECRRRRLFLENDIKSLMSVGAEPVGMLQSRSSRSALLGQDPPDSARIPLLDSTSA